MNDTEFHRSPENWPQPPDESSTLARSAKTTIAPKPKKTDGTDRKKRKKLSESLAGVTAAAVTVVMVANALPELFTSQPTVNNGDICPICERESCAYYRRGYGEGLTVTVNDRPTYSGREDIYDMPGFSVDDQNYITISECILTDEGQRLTLRINSKIEDYIPHINRSHTVLENTDRYESDQPAYTGFFARMDNAGDQCQDCFLYGALVYAPNGNIPAPNESDLDQSWYEVDACNPGVYSTYRDVPGLPKVQLQLVTDLPGANLEAMIDCFELVQVQAEPLSFSLGETMRFTESEILWRSYGDYESWSSLYDYGFETEQGEEVHFLDIDFVQKCYGLYRQHWGTYEIVFAAADWHTIMETWQTLNAQAPKYGHSVDYPIVKLQDVRVNGITYQCYAMYTAEPVDDINHFQWVNFYYVPEQEPTVAFTNSISASPEEMQYMLQQREVPNGEYYTDTVLKHITLR